jgi:DNA invertase Pin-like site-specific DNA recombinase
MNIVEYMRVGRAKAVIYVRGHNEGMQEMMCKLYAEDKGYDVVDVVKNIEEVDNCDVLLVSHVSRVSINYIQYLHIVNTMQDKGIKIESALNTNDKVDDLKNFTSLLIKHKKTL